MSGDTQTVLVAGATSNRVELQPDNCRMKLGRPHEGMAQ